MRLVHRMNNLNKETLIYIPLPPCRHNLSVYNLYCKTTQQIVKWLFIIITRPTHISEYVSWCTTQHTYIHIWVSRDWLLKIDNETNKLCLQWVLCILGITAQDVPLLVHRTCREVHEGIWSYCIPIQEGEIGEPAYPVERLEAHR